MILYFILFNNASLEKSGKVPRFWADHIGNEQRETRRSSSKSRLGRNMRGSTIRYSRPAPVRQGSQPQAQPIDRREARRLNKYGAASGGINMSSGAKQ